VTGQAAIGVSVDEIAAAVIVYRSAGSAGTVEGAVDTVASSAGRIEGSGYTIGRCVDTMVGTIYTVGSSVGGIERAVDTVTGAVRVSRVVPQRAR